MTTTQERLIVKAVVGSQLYGTASESSDLDYRGVYLPTLKDCITNSIEGSIVCNTKVTAGERNSKGDVDYTIFSLQHFLKNLERDTLGIEMLHASDIHLKISSPLWEELRRNRHRFYTRDFKCFFGFILKRRALLIKELETDNILHPKGISHAFRMGMQLKQIYKSGDLSFPFNKEESLFLKELKVASNITRDTLDLLNSLISELEVYRDKSSYPERVSPEWIDSFIYQSYSKYLL
jgi:predicted nucleotidyltransferase